MTEIDDPARIPELVSRAFAATSGSPGPVVIALPEDMLTERIVAVDAPAFEPVETSPGAAEMEHLLRLILTAERLLADRRRQSVVGGGRVAATFAEVCLAGGNNLSATHLSTRCTPATPGNLAMGQTLNWWPAPNG